MKTLFLLLLSALTLAALEVGKSLPEITLSGDEGGRLDGRAWSSSELKGKLHLLFYVDPDEKDLNNDFSDAIKAEAFDRSSFASVAIINMAATWKPNFAINAALKKKQQKFKRTLYLRDMDKKLVSEWGLADDDSDVILFDKTGRVLFYHAGKIDAAMTKTVIQLIKEQM